MDEIYGIRESGKYAGLKHVYNEFYKIYHPEKINELPSIDSVIVEDTNSGYEFFSSLTVDGYPEVISSEGKSGVFAKIMENTGKKCLIVADGAAFGSEIDRVMKQITDNDDIILFLPESFEWLLLKSGLIDGNRVQDILQSPELYIRSED